jgi:Tol biopolymer transport system component
MICAALLVRGYFSLLTQSVTETLPVAHSTFTPTSVDPVNPTSPPVVLPSDTPLPSPTAEFWVSYDSNPNGNRDIFLLNPVTGEQQGVITDPSHDKVGTWSPDGKLLAFESNRGNSNFYQIYLFDSEQGSTTKLTDFIDCSNFAPTWSPDGNKIVFYSTCENSQRDIYIMNRDGTGRKNLSSSSGEDKFPVFSPDGSLIAFTSTRNAKNQIFLMNADGSNQRYIADGCSSSFSPDGNSLWFSSSTACEDGNITHVQINGANLATVGTVTGRNPAVSPDGRVVVFQSNDDLWIVDVDGSNLQQLTSGSTEDGAPSWKP